MQTRKALWYNKPVRQTTGDYIWFSILIKIKKKLYYNISFFLFFNYILEAENTFGSLDLQGVRNFKGGYQCHNMRISMPLQPDIRDRQSGYQCQNHRIFGYQCQRADIDANGRFCKIIFDFITQGYIMTKCKSELSVTERMIIQLIKFRTGNERHPTFFGNNENIAKCIDIQPDTARKAVAKLIKLGYLKKHFDKQGRRHLIYTNKEFVPIIENMNNIDKKVLKNEKEYYEAEAEYATKELNLANIRIEHLEKEAEELRSKLFWANLRIKGLENIFTSRGLTREQIEILIKETQDQENA